MIISTKEVGGAIINKTSFVLFALLLFLFCSSVCATYRQPPPNYGTETLNFKWSYLYYYGDQINSTSNIFESPYDFILSQDNSSLLVLDWSHQLLKEFKKFNLDNFTVVVNTSSLSANSVEQTGQNSFAFGCYGPIQLYNGSQVTPLSFVSSFGSVLGLYYDGPSTLYVSGYDNSRVVEVSISGNNGSLVRLYGKTSIIDLTQNRNATLENMGGPWHIRLDCLGNLWVVDYIFNRIVRYKAGTTTPDLLWGQTSWTGSSQETAQNRFFTPFDIVFDASCSIAFVADYNRVLLFRAPFVSNQSAEGVLGALNFTTLGSFGKIHRLQLEQTGNSSGLLYILDNAYRRVVVGEIQWELVSEFACSFVPAGPGECVIQQPVALEGTVITVPTNYTTIVIEGGLTMDNSTQIRINAQQQIQTSGNVTLAGQLIIVLTGEANTALEQSGRAEITVIITNSTMRGEFSAVTIEGDTSECGARTEEEYTGKSIRVLITRVEGCGVGSGVGDGEEKKAVSSGAIAGIVIGGAGGVVIVIVVVGIGGGIIGWRRRERIKRRMEVVQGASL